MNDVLGLLAFVLFCAAIVSAAAGITWLVVRLAPPKKPETTPKT
ncbi:MAG: hypothetical protein ACRDLE_07450 [Gaiellaceae bacterium]